MNHVSDPDWLRNDYQRDLRPVTHLVPDLSKSFARISLNRPAVDGDDCAVTVP
jgi:hypothetical protein